jgi:hypothetical protein
MTRCLRGLTEFLGSPVGCSYPGSIAYGITAETWFEKTLSFPLESTAVVT